MAGEINLGNVVGLLKSEIAPAKTYLIWAKVLNPMQPDIVVLHYYDAVALAWLPLFKDSVPMIASTRAEILAKIAAVALVAGQKYLVTDRGNTNPLGIIMEATTTTTVSRKGINLSRLPKTSIVVWKSSSNGGTYAADVRVQYANLVYKHKTITNTNTIPPANAVNWEQELTNVNTYYETVSLEVEYDIVADQYWSLRNVITDHTLRLTTQSITLAQSGLPISFPNSKGIYFEETTANDSRYYFADITVEKFRAYKAYFQAFQAFGGAILDDIDLNSCQIINTVFKSEGVVRHLYISGNTGQFSGVEVSASATINRIRLQNVNVLGFIVRDASTVVQDVDMIGGEINDVIVQTGASLKNMRIIGGKIANGYIQASAQVENLVLDNGQIVGLNINTNSTVNNLKASNGASININVSDFSDIDRIEVSNEGFFGFTGVGAIVQNISIRDKAKISSLTIEGLELQNLIVEGDFDFNFIGAVVDENMLNGLSNSYIGPERSTARFIVNLDTYLAANVLTLPTWAKYAGTLILDGASSSYTIASIVNLPTTWNIKIVATTGKTITLNNTVIGSATANTIVMNPAANTTIVGRSTGSDYIVFKKEGCIRQVYQSKL